jgi:hypothetical protein
MKFKPLAASVGMALLPLAGSAFAACNLVPAPAQAELIESGDAALAQTHCIGPLLTVPSLTKRHIDNFGFAAQNWDGGWGWDDLCDKRLPMGRVLNSLELLYSGMPGPTPAASDMSGNLLHSGYNFTNRAVGLTTPTCSTESAARYRDLFVIGALEIFAEFPYRYSVVTRAGVMVHEARHQTHKHLTHRSRSGGFCTLRPITTCDLRWSDNGAFTYETLWLWWFAVEGDNVTSIMRRQAVDEASWIADNAFDEQAPVTPWCNC